MLYIFVAWLRESIVQKVPSLRVMFDHDNLRSWVSICLIRPRTLCQVKNSSIALKYRSRVSGDTTPPRSKCDIFDKKIVWVQSFCQTHNSLLRQQQIPLLDYVNVSDPWYESNFGDRACSLRTYASGQVGEYIGGTLELIILDAFVPRHNNTPQKASQHKT